ncbi:Tyrosine aminotransferase [Porphyridium purpureum]|uniref:Tyrosine aminotransferase n=1 Tax=Porphyridium purpureum TaxID=35688 RepID=A0A5J4Z1G3_PORPP|nr:Tyrosine aminotransferase [Porphyridium purpureum]|eukprot:POR2508..scf208_2
MTAAFGAGIANLAAPSRARSPPRVRPARAAAKMRPHDAAAEKTAARVTMILENKSSDSVSGTAASVHRSWEHVKGSKRAENTVNPIRRLVQGIDVKPNPALAKIDLSIGDPTVYGNLKPPREAEEALAQLVLGGTVNGYPPSMGVLESRRAVAEFFSTPLAPLEARDVYLTAGGSGALELALGAVADPGDNVLVPQPGFPLFMTTAGNLGIECKRYLIDPDRQWEANLDSIRAAVDDRTRAVVLNNPSNPCGSVWSAEHVQKVVELAAELKLVVLADEIYADMVFPPNTFVSAAEASRDAPVLVLGGISKRYVVPGWRLGWVLVHDRHNILEHAGMRNALNMLTMRMLIPSMLVQAVLPTLMDRSSVSVQQNVNSLLSTLQANAMLCVQRLGRAPALQPLEPGGALYLMVRIDLDRLGFRDDMEFTKALYAEQAVFVLPGQCFEAPGFVRIVFAAPREVLSEAMDRIQQFCEAHSS